MEFVEPIRNAKKVKEIGEYIRNKNGEKYDWLYSIGIYSGLRISDILTLKVKDVKQKRSIKIREKKTGKERYFPINPELKLLINKYCINKHDNEYLFHNRNGNPISRQYAYRIIHEAGLKNGIDHLGTHTLRKTFGYHFYTQKKDIVLLQKILNHKDPSITLRYIGIEQDTINQAMSHFHY